MKRILGIDIGGTKTTILLATVRDDIVIEGRQQIQTGAQRGFEKVWADIIACADRMVDEAKRSEKKINAIGVSFGGPLDAGKGTVNSPPNLPGWDDIPVTRFLTERYGLPAFLCNDANAGALVEWTIGAGQGSRDMVFLTMGTGLGCGIIADGRLVQGVSGLSGEIGHIRLSENGPMGYGKPGSAEGFCSGAGIARLIDMYTKEKVSQGKTPRWELDGLDEVGAKELADYANSGDGDALALWDVIGSKLGELLAILVDCLNPEKIVIGSIFIRCETLLRPSMERVLQREALQDARTKCEVLPAATLEQIGDYAPVLAACYALGILPRCAKRYAHEKARRYYDELFFRKPELNGCRDAVKEAYDMLVACYDVGGKLLVCGNGGSAADSDHIVGELMKGFNMKRPLYGAVRELVISAVGEDGVYMQHPLAAISLCQHTALSTAFSNDVNPEYTFAQQVLGYGRKEDLLLAITTSGKSKNVLTAARLAHGLGLGVIALTGSFTDGLSAFCDTVISCPGAHTYDIQENHISVYHTLCAMVEAAFFGED